MSTRRFIVEADGGSRGNPGPAAFGALVRDAESGEVLWERGESIGVATNNVAEYRGVLAGLSAVRDLDPDARVEVRADSKLVVEQMSGRWKIKHADMQDLAAQVRAVFPAGRVTYTWVPREKNKYADRLANEAMDAAAQGRQWEPKQSAAATSAAAAAESPEDIADAKSVPPPAGWGPDLGTPTTLVLLRHGETALTPQKRFSGSGGGTDPELSEHGLWQAERAAEFLASRGTVQAVISSPLTRCRQTADAAARRLGLQVRVEEGFRETDFGAWEGLTFGEVRDRWPDELAAWLDSPDAAPPGGESFTEVTRRVAVARDKVLARHPAKTVLVVTHVTPIKTLVRLALDAPAQSMFRMELSAAAITSINWWADGNASLRVFNETSHLRP
ncbi:bifunctional RNase H/acid phosphatase [Yinghuangia seranimata]|uniref:bifunctional RNase H/acid phosphatase n=1 Tax=Yinghuangia seranimata TaxID=408067 RepID=UPI00248AE1C2|nr:bifunctional RNase H/acid phosphatase [Yinghuangia seranimata]MDI2128590.1 bifunctional RNase H/acid phosphatase [Yinghuangia seranimata]